MLLLTGQQRRTELRGEYCRCGRRERGNKSTGNKDPGLPCIAGNADNRHPDRDGLYFQQRGRKEAYEL